MSCVQNLPGVPEVPFQHFRAPGAHEVPAVQKAKAVLPAWGW